MKILLLKCCVYYLKYQLLQFLLQFIQKINYLPINYVNYLCYDIPTGSNNKSTVKHAINFHCVNSGGSFTAGSWQSNLDPELRSDSAKLFKRTFYSDRFFSCEDGSFKNKVMRECLRIREYGTGRKNRAVQYERFFTITMFSPFMCV